MPRWYRGFGYDVAGPMRRDFSLELLRAGNDFGAALESAALARDYTPAERARDFAGAMQWNLRNTLAPGRSSRAGRGVTAASSSGDRAGT